MITWGNEAIEGMKRNWWSIGSN